MKPHTEYGYQVLVTSGALPGKDALLNYGAMDIRIKGRGSHFDPAIVDAFKKKKTCRPGGGGGGRCFGRFARKEDAKLRYAGVQLTLLGKFSCIGGRRRGQAATGTSGVA